jgi:acyl transferase domain-containing protein
VFLGITNADFACILANSSSVYAATGGSISVAAGRISFAFGMHGPCQSLDTACSSAVVALHNAVRAVDAGETSTALATAVSLVLTGAVSIRCCAASGLTLGKDQALAPAFIAPKPSTHSHIPSSQLRSRWDAFS